MVSYREIDKIYSLRGKSNSAFRSNIKILRKKLKGTGYRLENVNRVGYRMRRRTMRMTMVGADEFTAPYASDLQEVLLALASRHDQVTLSQQICIIGVTIGMLIEQISPEHQSYYRELLFRNVKDAKHCADLITLN